MLKDQIGLVQALECLLLRVYVRLELHLLLLILLDLQLELRDSLIFLHQLYIHFLLLRQLLFFITLGDFIDQHLPFVFVHPLEELLVDLKDANDDVLSIFEVMSALVNRFVESIRVHVEGFLNP